MTVSYAIMQPQKDSATVGEITDDDDGIGIIIIILHRYPFKG